MSSELTGLAGWYGYMAWWQLRDWARDTWQALPGPWWVKVAIIAACLAIPGAFDEIALLFVLKAVKSWKARKSA